MKVTTRLKVKELLKYWTEYIFVCTHGDIDTGENMDDLPPEVQEVFEDICDASLPQLVSDVERLLDRGRFGVER